MNGSAMVPLWSPRESGATSAAWLSHLGTASLLPVGRGRGVGSVDARWSLAALVVALGAAAGAVLADDLPFHPPTASGGTAPIDVLEALPPGAEVPTEVASIEDAGKKGAASLLSSGTEQGSIADLDAKAEKYADMAAAHE